MRRRSDPGEGSLFAVIGILAAAFLLGVAFFIALPFVLVAYFTLAPVLPEGSALMMLGVAAAIGLVVIRLRRRDDGEVTARSCSSCGYDLRAHAAGERCPECGAPVVGAGRVG